VTIELGVRRKPNELNNRSREGAKAVVIHEERKSA